MLLCIFFAVFFQLLYMTLLMDNCSYKLFFVGIFNSKNLPIFLLRRFMPLFIIALSTLEVNDFQPMGITPAYAGKSSIYTSSVSVFTDHPRLCGEKGIGETAYEGNARITPAYAGKRDSGTGANVPAKDHPRLCGEKTKYQCTQ